MRALSLTRPTLPRLPDRALLRRLSRRQGLALAVSSFFLILLWTAATKPLNAPDEPAHIQAVMQVRKQLILPEVHYNPGDSHTTVIGHPIDEGTVAYSMALGRTDWWMITPYEATQPPLYYLLAGGAALLVPPTPQAVLYISRLITALFGAATVYCCWAAVRELAPRAPLWAVATAGAVALLPQFCANSSSVSNDSTANFAAAAAFFVWFRGLRRPTADRWMIGAGAMLGLCVLAKLTTVSLAPALGLVWLFRVFQAPPTWRARLERGLRLAGGATAGAAAVCGWWLVRNILIYGEPTGTTDSLRVFRAGFSRLDPTNVAEFYQSTWESIWGRFGWMDISIPAEAYMQARFVSGALLALSALAGLGLLLRAVIRRRGVPTFAWQAALVMAVAAGGIIAGYVQFNLTVAFQAQGRYMFTLLLPAAMLFTGGLHALLPGRWLKTLGIGLLLIWLSLLNMAGLTVVSLVR